LDEKKQIKQLGATYEELEWAMIQDEEGKSATDFLIEKRIVYEIYKRLNKINQHSEKHPYLYS
jgi:NAD+ synthase